MRRLLAPLVTLLVVAASLTGCAATSTSSSIASQPQPTDTIALLPSPTQAVQPFSPPTTEAIPATPGVTITPTTTAAKQDPLVEYVLGLINTDRAQNGLAPVTLGNNPAAQEHAEDMFNNYFLSHWGTDGLKPYMRFTLGGGVNYEEENSAYSGWYDKTNDPNRYVKIDPEQELKQLEYDMMYDDAGSDWGHRDNILNEWHKKVNIGIAYDAHRLTLVEEFQGDYITFTGLPMLANGTLTMSGNTSLGTVDSVDIFYDPPPQPMTQAQLLDGPNSYSLGERVVTIVPPPPPGYYYTQLPPSAIQATYWTVTPAGEFSIQADIDAVLAQQGPGVYTVVMWTKSGADHVMLTNYSLFVK